MKRGRIKVATCQFAEGDNVRRNAASVRRQMAQAKRRGADVAVFHEAALTGYPAGLGKSDWRYVDWDELRAETEAIAALARKLKLWVIVGSAHPLSGRHRPHNCAYAISAAGRVVERYDKRFCTGADLRWYSPGDHFSTFSINGVKCGLLICYDVRFPELYREYKKLGVQLMFHPFHNARGNRPDGGIWRVIMRPTIQAHAAINAMFVSAPNSCARYQSWPGVFIEPDGVIASSHRTGRAGVNVDLVDTTREYYDASRPYRGRSMAGRYNSGTVVKDPRSRDRRSL